MLSGGKRSKTTIGLISKKATLYVQHSFFVHFFAVFFTTTTWNFQKLLSYTFYGGNVVRVLVHFFSLPLIFTLHWWPLAFLILSPTLHNFHVVLPPKNCLGLCFLPLRSKSLSPFLSLRFTGLPLTFCFSVCLLLYIPNLWTRQFI